MRKETTKKRKRISKAERKRMKLILTGGMAIIVLLVIIILGVFVFYLIKVKIEERDKIMSMRNHMLESNYVALQKAYNENRMLSHDFKNHMLAVNQLLSNKEFEVAEEYIETYIECMKATKQRVECGCKIIDIILNSKIEEAIDKEILFEYDIDYIGKIMVDDIDMCALLANLIDNSIESCMKVRFDKKWIKLNIVKNKEMLFILLENSVLEKQKEKRNFWETDKSDKIIHGLGTKSIDNVIKKYSGYKEYNLEKDKINIFISIPV